MTYIYNRPQIVIDIETMADLSIIDKLPEPKISSVLKNPEKIAEAEIEARQKQIEEMALNPLYSKIACVGLYNEFRQEVLIGSEIDILNQLEEVVNKYQIITFGGLNFDIPYIFKRGIINKCKWASLPNLNVFIDRYKGKEKHIDLMFEWCSYGKYESLDNLANFLLNDRKVEFDFKKIPTLLESEKGIAELKNYCITDCRLTWELAEILGFIKNNNQLL